MMMIMIMRRKTRSFIKLTIGTEFRTQLVTSIKVRRGQPTTTVALGRS